MRWAPIVLLVCGCASVTTPDGCSDCGATDAAALDAAERDANGGGIDAAGDFGLSAADAPAGDAVVDATDGATCGTHVVDLANDPDNCGACGTRCCSMSCVGGWCFADGVGLTVCPHGPDGCTNTAVNLATDSANCGACGCACPAGGSCIAGSCACATGRTNCCASGGSACTDTVTDPSNCGACGRVCSSGVCVSGTCR